MLGSPLAANIITLLIRCVQLSRCHPLAWPCFIGQDSWPAFHPVLRKAGNHSAGPVGSRSGDEGV